MAVDWRRIGRRVWLANGLLLLPALLLVVVGVSALLLPELLGGGAPAAVAVGPSDRSGDDGPARPRAVRYDTPEPIRGSAYRLVQVHHGKAEQSRIEGISGSTGYNLYDRDAGPLVNIVFLAPDGSGRLLLDRPALITELDYPRDGFDEDSLQRYIAYRIVLEDSDDDGRLTEDDERSLYVSDLAGGGLRPVLPPTLRLRSYAAATDGRQMIVLALDSAGTAPGAHEDEWRQRAFRFDLATGALEPFTALDSLAGTAGRILAR